MSALDELSQSITRLAGSVAPSVVGIGSRLRGSGVVVADGQVLTNAHNVRGDEVTVTFADGRSAAGRLAGIDVDGDLAVIEIDTAGAPALTWADGDGPAIGAIVFAAAATPGGGARVTFGTISAVERSFRGPGGRRIGGSLEHTAPLAPGSSGAPLLDADGRLVGLNTNRLGEGFYLALPADAALRSASRPSAAVSRSAGHGSGSRLRHLAWPATCASRSVCRPVTASSSATSRTTARPHGRGSATAT